MKRPVFIFTLGFLFGIIKGLYFLNIAPFITSFNIILVSMLKFVNIKSKNICIKLFKIYIKNNILLVFLIASIISNLYIIYLNNKYEEICNNFKSGDIVAIVVSNKKESQYKNIYKIKLKEFNNKKYKNIYLLLETQKDININYGDKINFFGEYNILNESRNYKGFDYRKYSKTKKIYGKVETNKVRILKNNNINIFQIASNYIKNKTINNISKILPKDTSQLFLGILIGYTNNLQEGLQEDFKQSNLTHLLAVSGTHIAYIILSLNYFLKQIKVQVKIRNIFIIIFLIFFTYIVDFSASIVRATIMGIIVLISKLLHKKQDINTTISISILLILIDNPYKILDIGLILSFFATIGIILFSKFKNKELKENIILKYLKNMILITIFANIFIILVIAYNFNTVSINFIISNLLAGILISPITIIGFIIIILSFIKVELAYIISIPYNILLKALVLIANIVSKLPFSQIIVKTPSIILIIMYYLVLTLIYILFLLRNNFSNRFLVKKIIHYIYKLKKKIILTFILILMIIFLFNFIFNQIYSKDLSIYFVDVGQGDCTLIVTPKNKKILIDSGGVESDNFDIGENVLFPYLVDRGIKELDYAIISHFDSDHSRGLIYLLENIDIKNIVISKQYENTKNFEEIIKIVKKKDINLVIVKKRDKITIEKNLYIYFLWPKDPQAISENSLNNNAIVNKLVYKEFSMLFTGDIEEKAESKIIEQYKNDIGYLKSNILKVAHHGSNTSSTEKFINLVKPQISLIGVGKENKFGHPNKEVIKILEKINSKIYRTDLNGEIIIKINKNRKNKSKNTY